MNHNPGLNIFETLDHIQSIVREVALSLPKEKVWQNELYYLDGVQKELAHRNFILMMLGDWNSGKSSLINYILNTSEPPLLTVGDRPVTSRITVLTYGPKPKLHKTDWGKGEREEDIAIGENAVRVKLEELNQVASETPDESLIVEWDHPLLQSGVTLIDTPGLEDPNEKRSLLTVNYVKNADGVILVTEASRPMTKHILNFISDHSVSKHASKFFVLVNKTDRLDLDEETPDEVMHFVRQVTEKTLYETSFSGTCSSSEFYSGTQYFPVSSKTGEGMTDFYSQLIRFANSTERLQRLKSSALNKMELVLGRLESHFHVLERATNVGLDDILERKAYCVSEKQHVERQINNKTNIFQREWTELLDRNMTEISRIYEHAVTSYRSGKHDAKSGVWKKINVVKYGKSMSALCKQIQMDLSDELDDFQRKFTNDLSELAQDYIDSVAKILSEYHKTSTAFTSSSIPSMYVNKLEAEAFQVLILSAIASLAAGGVAFASGVGTIVTATTVSTLPMWVPGAVTTALAELGLFTTVATTSAFALGPILAVAGPIGIGVGVVSTTITIHRSHKKIEAALQKFEESLRDNLTTIKREIQKASDDQLPYILEGIKASQDFVFQQIDENIAECESICKAKAVPREIVEFATNKIPAWRVQLAALEGDI